MFRTDSSSDCPDLRRDIGLKDALAIHMGVMIGSGIFVVPATIAGNVPAVGPMVLVWVVGGLLTLFGALSVAELSAVLPQAGGPYVYLGRSFGRVWGFLFSWNDFFINKAASLAAIAIGFATYAVFFAGSASAECVLRLGGWTALGRPPELTIDSGEMVAIALIGIVTVINVLGVRWGALAMNFFTLAKVATLVGLILSVLVSDQASFANLTPIWPDHWNKQATTAFGVAMISVLFAYDGWIDVTLTAGETRNPARNLPLALLLGTLAVTFLYVVVNVAFAMVLPLEQMAHSPRIAADVASRVGGSLGASLVVVGILCSTFGAANGMALAGPRSIWAAGRDRLFAPSLGKVHSRYRSPHVAVVTLGIWASLLTLSGSYEQLTAYVMFGSWFFYALTVLGVIVLRWRMPDVGRPYKSWGYPVTTILFLLVSLWFLVNTLLESPRDALFGIGFLLAGLPCYAFWSRPRGSLSETSFGGIS